MNGMAQVVSLVTAIAQKMDIEHAYHPELDELGKDVTLRR
jgi:hypothetical protein